VGIAATSQFHTLDSGTEERPAADSSPMPDSRYLRKVQPETQWPVLLFHPGQYTAWTSNADGSKQINWRVRVQPDGHLITRHVWRAGEAWDGSGHRWVPERVIWPGWSARSREEIDALGSPLADMENYWSTVGNRLRDSAKWLATVLGAALATVIGTSPLAAMREHRMHGTAIMLTAIGLALLGATMFLVLLVMRPQSVSYGDVECAGPRHWLPQSSLWKLRQMIDSHQDLYLPCGVRSVSGLRESMIIEEATVMALSDAVASAADEASAQALCDTRAARAARLIQLRIAAARIAAIGEYYKLRTRSSWATYCGLPMGLLATAAIVTAFVWP
jgi:hypothetical protein